MGFDVFVGGVRRGQLVNKEVSNGVIAVASPDGTQVAAIPDFNGLHGTALIFMSVGRRPRTLVSAPVTSAAFSADGTRLAYTVQSADGASLFMGPPGSPGDAAGHVRGAEVTILGWQSDGSALFVQAYPAAQRDAVETAPDVIRVNLLRGSQERVLASDLKRGLAYRDVRLVTIRGAQYLSAVRAPSAFPCSNQPTDVVLASLDGVIQHSFGRTMDTYTEAVWSADGEQISFAAQACVSRQELATGVAAARSMEVAGVYLASTTTGSARQLIRGVPAFRLSLLRHGTLLMNSDRLGQRVLDVNAMAQIPVPADSLAPQTNSLIGHDNRAVHIHQLYDTRDAFDGRGSCGPTSCVMSMADYQLKPSGLWVDYGGRHWSAFGLYITDPYTYGAVTYSTTKVDYSGAGAWAGAHGFMFIPGLGSTWNEIKTYLNNHTGWAERIDTWDPAFARKKLDANYLLVAGGRFRGLSHIVLIKGYTAGGDWIVHDPYGPNTSGARGGADQTYVIGRDMTITRMVAN
jgi:hypothetical protein